MSNVFEVDHSPRNNLYPNYGYITNKVGIKTKGKIVCVHFISENKWPIDPISGLQWNVKGFLDKIVSDNDKDQYKWKTNLGIVYTKKHDITKKYPSYVGSDLIQRFRFHEIVDGSDIEFNRYVEFAVISPYEFHKDLYEYAYDKNKLSYGQLRDIIKALTEPENLLNISEPETVINIAECDAFGFNNCETITSAIVRYRNLLESQMREIWTKDRRRWQDKEDLKRFIELSPLMVEYLNLNDPDDY